MNLDKNRPSEASDKGIAIPKVCCCIHKLIPGKIGNNKRGNLSDQDIHNEICVYLIVRTPASAPAHQ
ncbi:hypothetical protein PRIO_2231 [Paenibacillus riograndensis SBR5]|uniref:Uncharacterized protein n=1 Tax=Paenibacillus riograndensis SBR5 TaxID=1073571 RepID=A0A0E4HA03_9BACL|nr:hypothetical protein PRIO_2231 [Paenibacillus riograndensis SBR5]